MENFEAIKKALATPKNAGERFAAALVMVKHVAVCSDEEHAEFYEMAVADEDCPIVRAALNDAKKMRVVFGGLAAAMQRTGACPETAEREKFEAFVEAFIEEMNFIGRLSKTEVDAMVASFERDWKKKFEADQ